MAEHPAATATPMAIWYRARVGDTVSIELLFDAETEVRVRKEWEALAQAGYSSLAAHRAPSNRPHLTLLVRPALAALSFAEAARALPLPITLGEPLFFPHGDRGVLARSVVAGEALTLVHRAVHAAVPPGEDAPHTAAGSWTPHVTLARRLRQATLDDGLALLGPPIRGQAVALRRWDAATRTVTVLG